MIQHAVALVPGFLGFDHVADKTYFADRFVAGLRAHLQQASGESIPVVAVPTIPIGSLAERQRALLDALRTAEARLQLFAPTWHLVGHSTGGLDAAMLGRCSPLILAPDGRTSTFAETGWGEEERLIERIESATTIATPHLGTTLADCPIAVMTEGNGITLRALVDLLQAAGAVLRRDDLLSRLNFSLSSVSSSSDPAFLSHLLFSDALARDLRPVAASTLTMTENRRYDFEVYSIATVAPRPVAQGNDRLYAELWNLTAEGGDDGVRALPAGIDVISSTGSLNDDVVHSLDGRSNDGIVNTLRQIDGELRAVVVGDHGDVTGRYRRVDPIDRKTIDTGLLTSGAFFSDDEFFELIACIGDTIAR